MDRSLPPHEGAHGPPHQHPPRLLGPAIPVPPRLKELRTRWADGFRFPIIGMNGSRPAQNRASAGELALIFTQSIRAAEFQNTNLAIYRKFAIIAPSSHWPMPIGPSELRQDAARNVRFRSVHRRR